MEGSSAMAASRRTLLPPTHLGGDEPPACCSNAQALPQKIISPYNAVNGRLENSWHVPSANILSSNYSRDTYKCLQTDDLNLLLSDVLIGSAEQVRWDQLTAGLEFSRPVPARAFFELCDDFRDLLNRTTSPPLPSAATMASSPRRCEGNSIFYAPTATTTSTAQSDKILLELNRQSPSGFFSARDPMSQRLRESMRHALFATYFGHGNCRPPRRSCSSTGSDSMAVEEAAQSSSKDDEAIEENENEWKFLAAFIDFPQELVALPDEIQHEHQLVRTASGRQCVRRRRRRYRRHSSSSTASSSSVGRRSDAIVAIPGARHWAPPRRKFIYELSTVNYKDLSAMRDAQDGRCGGCSRLFDTTTAKRARICHYYSRLFCQCCHQGATYVLPAQILHNWNFKEYLVCDVALQFLRENADQPVFHVSEINGLLYGRVKALRRTRDLRVQASHLWQYIQLCPHADRIETSHGYLRTMFTSVARRFLALENVHVFSVLDLISVYNGNMIETLEPLVNLGREHVEHCLECRQLAFFCQICGRDSDWLFPFQLERVYRCEGCGALSHAKCRAQALRDQRADAPLDCAKCERIRRKKIRQFHRSPSQKSELL